MQKQRKHKKADRNNLTISEHTLELKKRVLVPIIMFIIFFILVYYYNDKVILFLLNIGKQSGYSFFSLSAQEAILQSIKVSAYMSLILSFPVVFYELYRFASPALSKSVSFIFILTLGLGSILFLIGACFSYKILLPFVFSYLKAYSERFNLTPQISMENYLSFMIAIIIYCGLTFEMPLMSFYFGKTGIITIEKIKKMNPFIVASFFLIAAIITPPDVVSQLIVAIPMLLLYGVSIVIIKLLQKGN